MSLGQPKPGVTAFNILTTLATVFGLIGGILFNVHGLPFLPAAVLCFTALMMSSFALRMSLKNHHHKKRTYNGWCAGVIILSIIGCGLSSWLEYKPVLQPNSPDANLRIFVIVGNDPKNRINFINDVNCISSTIETNVFPRRVKPEYCVVIPTRKEQTNVVLNFGVLNDSAIDVDSIEVAMTVPTRSNWFLEQGWNRATTDIQYRTSPITGPPTLTEEESKTTSFNESFILHGDSVVGPSVVVPVKLNVCDWNLVGILTKAKQSKARVTGFNIAFITFPTNADTRPFSSRILKTSDGKNEWIKMPSDYKKVEE